MSSPLAAPVVDSVWPDSGMSDVELEVTITGSGFIDGAGVELQKVGELPIVSEDVQVLSTEAITATLDLADAADGAWDVIITNRDGSAGILAGGFTVSSIKVYLPLVLKKP